MQSPRPARPSGFVPFALGMVAGAALTGTLVLMRPPAPPLAPPVPAQAQVPCPEVQAAEPTLPRRPEEFAFYGTLANVPVTPAGPGVQTPLPEPPPATQPDRPVPPPAQAAPRRTAEAPPPPAPPVARTPVPEAAPPPQLPASPPPAVAAPPAPPPAAPPPAAPPAAASPAAPPAPPTAPAPTPPPAVPAPAPAAPAPAPAAPPPPAAAVYLQLGAYKAESEAEALRARIAALGEAASVLPVEVADKGTLYRVRVGPFTDPGALTQVRERLTQAGIATQQAILVR